MYQDAYSPMTLDQARAGAAGGPPAESPQAGFLESIALRYRRAGAAPDWGLNDLNWESRGINTIRNALRQRGHVIPGNPSSVLVDRDLDYDDYRNASTGNPTLTDRRTREAAQAMWAALAEERRRDPSFLANYGDVHDYATFAQHVAQQRNARVADIDRQRPQTIAGFAGDLGHGLGDPTSYIPVGGATMRGTNVARAIVSTALREGTANVAIAAATEPGVRADAARLGQERSVADFLDELPVNFIAGATIGGTIEAGHAGAQAAVPLAARVARDIATAEPEAPAFTPEQQAALHVATRAAEIRQQSPFLPGPSGDDAHADWLDAAMAAAHGRGPALIDRANPGVRPVSRADVAAGNVDGGALRNGAREQVKARIHRAEAPGRDDYNESSGATGPYQFLGSTWEGYFRRRYPNDRRSSAQIRALRRDPALNEVLMNDMLADNARVLARVGAPETPGNLYLLHFAGPGVGEAMLRADPRESAEAVWRRADPRHAGAAIAGNPGLIRGRTASEVIAWAHERMGGEAPQAFAAETSAVTGAEPDFNVPDIAPASVDVAGALDFGTRPVLRPDHFASPEEHAQAQLRFEAERDAREGYAQVRDPGDIPFYHIDHLDALRAYAEGPGSLRPEAVAEALGITPGQARDVQRLLAAGEGAPILIDRNGVARRRAEPERGPRSLLEFLADRGGIEDVGGNLRAMDAHLWHRAAPFRKRLLRERGATAEPGLAELAAHGEDASFAAAIEAGYFPEHAGLRFDGGRYADLPDLAQFRHAVDEELRGRPLYTPEDRFGDVAEADALAADHDEMIYRLEERAGELGYQLDAATLDDAIARRLAGQDADKAINGAVNAAAFRDLPPPAPASAIAHEEAAFADPTGEGPTAQAESLEHDLRMELTHREPDPEGPILIGDLWRLSTEDLERLLEIENMSEAEQLLEALGSPEKVKRFKQLDRARNGLYDTARADEASRQFDVEFGNLTPEQERLIYGVYGTPAADDIKAMLTAHSDVIFGDEADWAAYMAATAARKVRAEDMAKVRTGAAGITAQVEFVRMQRAYQVMAEAGVATSEIPRRMAEALVNRAGWEPEAAAEIIGGFVDDMRALAPERPPIPESHRLETYRLSEDGDEVGLASTLAEIDAARREEDAMRACLAPPKADAA